MTPNKEIKPNKDWREEIDDIDLQLAMCQSMTEVSEECIDRLAVVRNMLEDLTFLTTKAVTESLEEFAKKVKKLNEETPRYLKGGETKSQYFAKGWNEHRDTLRQALELLLKSTK